MTKQRPTPSPRFTKLIGFLKDADLQRTRATAYALLADVFGGHLTAVGLEGAIVPIAPANLDDPADGQNIEDAYRHNLALAYLELIRCGLEPRPGLPHRDERPATARQLLIEAVDAADRGDFEGYSRAVTDLATVAAWGELLTSQDIAPGRAADADLR